MSEYIKNLRKYVWHDPIIQCGASRLWFPWSKNLRQGSGQAIFEG
jgi:hypothetical protein